MANKDFFKEQVQKWACNDQELASLLSSNFKSVDDVLLWTYNWSYFNSRPSSLEQCRAEARDYFNNKPDFLYFSTKLYFEMFGDGPEYIMEELVEGSFKCEVNELPGFSGTGRSEYEAKNNWAKNALLFLFTNAMFEYIPFPEEEEADVSLNSLRNQGFISDLLFEGPTEIKKEDGSSFFYCKCQCTKLLKSISCEVERNNQEDALSDAAFSVLTDVTDPYIGE